MAILLKNLFARAPKADDLEAVAELIAACDIAEYGIADSTMEDLVSNWQKSGFNLATDAWVIVTTKGQLVGFACVWHSDHEQIYTFICVHPQYRNRGIGTLLLRLVEERARRHILCAREDARITLSSTLSSLNEQAKRLFEREGYMPVRQFWRIAIEIDEVLSSSSHRGKGKLQVELDVESQCITGAQHLFDRDGVYSIRQYNTYEKELRVGVEPCQDEPVRIVGEAFEPRLSVAGCP